MVGIEGSTGIVVAREGSGMGPEGWSRSSANSSAGRMDGRDGCSSGSASSSLGAGVVSEEFAYSVGGRNFERCAVMLSSSCVRWAWRRAVRVLMAAMSSSETMPAELSGVGSGSRLGRISSTPNRRETASASRCILPFL